MSQENVQLARGAYDAFNRRELNAFLPFMDEEVEMESRLVAIEGGYHGHEGMRRWWEDFLGAFPDYRIEVEEIRDLGDVTLSHFKGWGHSGEGRIPLIDPVWQPMRWRSGKVVWARVCLTESEALEAAGLSEHGMSRENVQVVRRNYEAFNAGDYATALSLMSSDIEYHELEGMPGAGIGVGVYRGKEELVRWYTEFLAQWESLVSLPEKITALGDHHVIAVETWRARGAKSQIDVERTAVGLYTLRDGQITSLRYFSTEAEAREAAGGPP